jgi:cytoskeletal protein RodZ
MAFTDMDEVEQELEEESQQTPSGPGNRNFWIIFGILGGIIVLALICIAVIAVINLPGRQNANATRAAQATAISFAATQTASAPRVTPTQVPPTRTPPPPTVTNTPLIPLAPTSTSTSVDAAIATRSALMTLAAEATAATALPTSTLLPGTGFADEVGVPGLLAMAVVLVVVIFLARRLRFAGNKAP